MSEKRSYLYEDLRIVKFLDDVGHWTQQEAPEAVNENFEKFLKGL
jgi:pimeloyl-ACP methyl ester carboxylesterase